MRKMAFVVTALAVMAILTGCTTVPGQPQTPDSKLGTPPVTQSSPAPQGTRFSAVNSAQLAGMLAKKDFVFVNVHVPYEGEIEKTDVFVPYNEVEKNLDKLPKDKGAKIVLYCMSGRMSAIAAETLASLGHSNLFDLSGGMVAWRDAGYQVIRR